MGRVLVTRPVPGTALKRLEAAGHVVDVRDAPLPPDAAELTARAAEAEGLLTLITDRVDHAVLDGAPRLRVIANFGIGSDNIDLAAARARGIAVGVTPDVLTDATADLAWALILGAARRVGEGEALVRSGGWRTFEPAGLLGQPIAGRTLVVVGPGRIGEAVARRAEGFAMEVLRVGRGDDLHAALAVADVISLHVPLTADTRQLIDAAALAVCRPTAVLVNTARGGVLDQVALAAALREGRLAAAGLDVTDPEPLPPGDPLLTAPNLVVLPHVGSATHAAREAMAERCVDNLLAGLAGEPLPFAAT